MGNEEQLAGEGAALPFLAWQWVGTVAVVRVRHDPPFSPLLQWVPSLPSQP